LRPEHVKAASGSCASATALAGPSAFGGAGCGPLSRRSRSGLTLAALLLATSCLTGPAWAEDGIPIQRNSYGEVGLLDLPSARMGDDGDLSLTISGMRDSRRIELGFQILPWLEGTFRYSEIVHYVDGPDYDRSFGMKARLFQETRLTPEISVGVRDIVGTGLFASEYIAASKLIGDFDVTGGIGWGRLASRGSFENPFALVFNSFKTRTPSGGEGGTFNFGEFFHGKDVGLFGGATWQTPLKELTVTAEYSSDAYTLERSHGGFAERSPVNLGVTYKPFTGVSATLGWFYGSTAGAVFSFSANPTQTVAPQKIGAPPIPVTLRSPEERETAVADLVRTRDGSLNASAERNAEAVGRTLVVMDRGGDITQADCARLSGRMAAASTTADTLALFDPDDPSGKVTICPLHAQSASKRIQLAQVSSGMEEVQDDVPAQGGSLAEPAADAETIESKIRDDADDQSLEIDGVFYDAHQMTVYYTNSHYEFEASAIGRLLRILMADAPPSIEVFHLVPLSNGEPMQDVRILRAPLEHMFIAHGGAAETGAGIALSPAPLSHPELDAALSGTYPRFNWSIAPSLDESFFDPRKPLRIRLYGTARASVDLFPGFSVEGEFEGNIYNDFSRAELNTSLLPHVRSDANLYFTRGRNGIGALDAVYHGRIAPDVYVEAKAGYLEDMFGGAGGQILWRPEGDRWSLGADVYEVWQRGYDRLFGFRPYHILTGLVSVYYQSPWYGLDFQLHAGRYLAGDYGATFEVARRFFSNVEIGTFVTFTNVPFSQFGEGSFDKGIIIRIPLEWALPVNTQSSFTMNLTPLTRDGGQRLADDDSLYDETSRTSDADIERYITRIGSP